MVIFRPDGGVIMLIEFSENTKNRRDHKDIVATDAWLSGGSKSSQTSLKERHSSTLFAEI